MMKPIKKCPVCGVEFDMDWHPANGGAYRFQCAMAWKTWQKNAIRPKWVNCCHCPHRNCTSKDCYDYHNKVKPDIVTSLIHGIIDENLKEKS